MDEIILRELRKQYCEYCRKHFAQEDYANEVLDHIISDVDGQGIPMINGILHRCRLGRPIDLKVYLDEQLHLPLGLKAKLYLIILSLWEHFSTESTVEESKLHDLNSVFINNTSSTTPEEQGVLMNLWQEWRQGKMTSMTYFTRLNDLVIRGHLDIDLMLSASNAALVEGGFISITDDRFKSQVKLCESGIGELIDISQLFLSKGGQVLDIFLMNRTHFRFSALNATDLEENEHSIQEKSYMSAIAPLPATSTSMFLWKKVSNYKNLTLISNDDAVPLLLVGDTIETSNGVVEVDRCHAVDVLFADAGSDANVYPLYSALVTRDLVLLVEGRFISNSSENDHNFMKCDSASELCFNEHPDNSPNGSGHEDCVNMIPDYSHQTDLYLIFGKFLQDFPTIVQVVALSDHMERDQVPISVRLLKPDVAIIHGSNGLLAAVEIKSSSLLRHYKRIIYKSLTVDTLTTDIDDRLLNVSHRSDVVVSLLSYRSSCDKLVTADSLGHICLWSTNKNLYTLLGRPYLVGPNAKVCSIFLSPSGEHVVVGLRDRLILLREIDPVRTFAMLGSDISSSLFYERCTLDVIEGVDMLYQVEFEKDVISIWRISSQSKATNSSQLKVDSTADDPIKLIITTWKHQNIDHFDSRYHIHNASSDFINNIQSQDNNNHPLPKIKEVSSEMDQDGTSLKLTTNDGDWVSTEGVSEPSVDDSVISNLEQENVTISQEFMLINQEYIPVHPVSTLFIPESPATSHSLLGYPQQNTGSTQSYYKHNHLGDEIPPVSWNTFLKAAKSLFEHDQSRKFLIAKEFLSVYGACFVTPPLGLLCSVMDLSQHQILNLLNNELSCLFYISDTDNRQIVTVRDDYKGIMKWMCSADIRRIGKDFWIDASFGHNIFCAIFLKFCGNKSIAVEHPYQSYLQTYGPSHLRRCSRGLRLLTSQIRKIDETAGIKYSLPQQIGYISGLQEIYARRVGLGGTIPNEIGQLRELRVLSMGNNRLTGKLPESLTGLKQLQRIVLHQNNLVGYVPEALGDLGCIVNLAGNPRLEYGADVPKSERDALNELFFSTKGHKWNTKTNWNSDKPVCKWYKVILKIPFSLYRCCKPLF